MLGLGAVALMAFGAQTRLTAAELATATFDAAQVAPGENQYNLTLNDTGTTTVGTFWFAWVPGDNFMPVSPTNIVTPDGWVSTVTQGGPSGGFAIQWKAAQAGNDLAAGDSLSGFGFESTLTEAQLESPAVGHPTDPVVTSFIYSGAPFSDAGVQITPTATPEPAEVGLGMLGTSVLLLAAWRRKLIGED